MPAILFIFVAAARERDAALERMETEARHLGGLASREHAQQLNGGKRLLRRLSSVLACGGGPKTTVPACPDYLPALLSGLPQLANIGVADPSGQVVCSAAPLEHVASLKTNEAFERALGSAEVEAGTYVLGFVGRPVIHLARALEGAGSPPCGVVFVAVELGWLDQLAEQANLPPDYSLLITDRSGDVLARSGATARREGGEHALPTAALAQAIARPRGAVLEIGVAAAPRYYVATAMDGLPGIFVVVGLPFDRMQGAADRAFYRTLVGLILVTIFAIASAVLAAEISVLRDLRALTSAVHRFGAGDLSARAPLPRSHGELRELAVTFGRMAEALGARQREARDAQDRLRALSHRLQTARDEEAGRIARELHDELGQLLTGLKMELARVRRLQASGLGAGPGESATVHMAEQIDQAIESVRRISSELRPPVLDRLGLAAAVDWLVRDCEGKTDVAIVLNVEKLGEPVDPLVSTAIFRIVQEALTNVVRHASAKQVRVELVGSDDTLALTIHDDGRGIEPTAAEGPRSLGIIGMRERVHLVGGSFRIEGGPDKGTAISVTVPRRPRPPAGLAPGGEGDA